MYLVVVVNPLLDPDLMKIDTLQTAHQICVYDTPVSNCEPMRMRFGDTLCVGLV